MKVSEAALQERWRTFQQIEIKRREDQLPMLLLRLAARVCELESLLAEKQSAEVQP